MPYTIQGQILSEVWLEFSIDGGATWTRLPNTFPFGTSIVTSDLPTGVDLKVRLVAVCDETTISNEIDYDYIEPPVSDLLIGGISNELESFESGCNEQINYIVFFKTASTLFLSTGDIVYNTNDESNPFVGVNSKYYKITISDPLWGGVSSSYVVTISTVGVIQLISQTC